MVQWLIQIRWVWPSCRIWFLCICIIFSKFWSRVFDSCQGFSFPQIFPPCTALGASPSVSHPQRLDLCIISLVSQKCTNQCSAYQSAYPGTPLSKRPLKASRTNRRTLIHPYQNNPQRHQVPISVPWYKNTVIYLCYTIYLCYLKLCARFILWFR